MKAVETEVWAFLWPHSGVQGFPGPENVAPRAALAGSPLVRGVAGRPIEQSKASVNFFHNFHRSSASSAWLIRHAGPSPALGHARLLITTQQPASLSAIFS